MAARKKRRKTAGKSPGQTSGRGRKYSAGELFIAILGGALIVLFIGIVISSILGN